MYLENEVTAFHKYNPLEAFAGASPVAPLRLTLDTARQGLLHNRNMFANGGIPDFLLLTDSVTVQAEVDEFYARWDKKYSGPEKQHRPAFMGGIKAVERMAFSNRDSEFKELLNWYIQESARTYGVPEPFLGLLANASLQNVANLYRFLWEHDDSEGIYLDKPVKMDDDLCDALRYALHSRVASGSLTLVA